MSLIKRPNSRYWYVQFQIDNRTFVRSTRTTERKIALKIADKIRADIHQEVTFTMHESGCLVSEIKPVRKNRYDVELDCREFDEIYQYQFFLDVISDQHVRVNGDDLWICKKGFLATEASTLEPAGSADDLIAAWADADENCAGGSGDNPATEAACTLRQQLAEKLNQKDLCFGREKQSRNGYDWHQCDAGSLR